MAARDDSPETRYELNKDLAKMLKGGVIMDASPLRSRRR